MSGRVRPRPGEALALLRRNADFRRLFLASVVSFAGDWFSFVAVSGLVRELTGRDGAPALVFAAELLPVFLLSPLAGIVVDRFDRRRIMIAADLLRIPPALLLILAATTGQALIAYVAVVLLAVGAGFFQPATGAALPSVVDSEDLPLAQAILGSVWGSMLFVGAGLGGLFAGAFGREASFVVNAASFALSALFLLRIRRPFRTGAAAARASVRGHLGEVWRYARANKPTRSFLGTKAGVGVGNGIVGLLAVYAHRFGAGDRGIGILLASRGVGALVGPFIARRLVRGDGRRHVAACGLAIVTYGVAYLTLPVAGSLAVAALVIGLAHAGGGAQWMLSTYGLQVTTPDVMRGRVLSIDFGLATLAVGTSSIAAAAAVEAFGLTSTSLVLAGFSLTYGLVWLAWTRDLWAADHDPLAPQTAAALV